jgi:hypothetical protein
MDTLCQPALENLRLQSPFQEIFDLQSQHVIQSHAGFVQHSDTNESANKCVTLEKTLGIFVIKLKKLTSSSTNFGKDKGDTPKLSLVSQTVLASKLCKSCLIHANISLKTPTFNSASRRADPKGRRGTL